MPINELLTNFILHLPLFDDDDTLAVAIGSDTNTAIAAS